MDELPMFRALQLAESNLAIGYHPVHAVRKATEACGVNFADLALLLMQKVVYCSRAREERTLLAAYDRLVDHGPATSAKRTGRGVRATSRGEQHG